MTLDRSDDDLLAADLYFLFLATMSRLVGVAKYTFTFIRIMIIAGTAYTFHIPIRIEFAGVRSPDLSLEKFD